MDTTGRLKFNNKGFAIIWLAFLLPMLIFVIAIVVDFGYMYVAKGQLQNAADAAALAGAARLNRGTVVSAFDNYSGSRMEAWKIASSNKSAGKSVFLVYSTVHNSPDRTKLNIDNEWDGDIVVGNWSDTNGFRPREGVSLPSGTEINAVKVVARRTSDNAETNKRIGNNPVPIIFGRILSALSNISFLGGASMNWTTMSAKAEAIAIKEKAEVLPIVVNEYWLDKDTGSEPARRPYDDTVHTYPNSFVRVTNVDLTPSAAYGRIFAVTGANAETNMPAACGAGTGANINGYVNLDYRNTTYAINPNQWFQLNTGAGAISDCSNPGGCPSGFTGPMSVTQGAIDSQKSGISLNYLYGGYPDNYMLPTAIKERDLRTVPPSGGSYPCGSANIYPTPTSDCPYATVAYFTSGGTSVLNTSSPFNSTDFYSNFPPGKKVVALVYDGTYQLSASSGANGTTIVGYVLLQIDGYANGNPKGLHLSDTTNDLSASGGNTMYAHAISNIVEPSTYTGSVSCDPAYINAIRDLQFFGGISKLVK